MTNMVDVMLLLLIFFTISTTFINRPSMKIEVPEAVHIEDVRTDGIMISIAQDGSLFLDGKSVSRHELKTRVIELAKQDKTSKVAIEADRSVPYGTVIQTIDMLRDNGLRHIILPMIRQRPET